MFVRIKKGLKKVGFLVDKNHKVTFSSRRAKITVNLKLVRNLQQISLCCRSGISEGERERGLVVRITNYTRGRK